jgi:hypothetical protein
MHDHCMHDHWPASRHDLSAAAAPLPAVRAEHPSHAARPQRQLQLRVHDAADPARQEVEHCIRTVYAQHHGATVRSFAPTLVSLHDGQRIVAAAGYRFATQPLFLECYLDAPVEQLLAMHTGTAAPSRAGIVEVGHLAAAQSGAGRRLIGLLGPHLAALGTQWVVSTLTQELRDLFLRMGVAPLALGAADPARLGDQAADWGSYYEHKPLVLAGNLAQALRLMQAGRLARAGHA